MSDYIKVTNFKEIPEGTRFVLFSGGMTYEQATARAARRGAIGRVWLVDKIGWAVEVTE